LQLSRLQFRTKQAAGKIRRFIRANIYTDENEKLLARRESHLHMWHLRPALQSMPHLSLGP